MLKLVNLKKISILSEWYVFLLSNNNKKKPDKCLYTSVLVSVKISSK